MLVFKVDAKTLAAEFEGLQRQVEDAIRGGVQAAAQMTYGKVLELANDGLNTTRKLYTDNLTLEQVDANIWAVTLKEPAMWVEEGMKGGFMQQLLDSPKARTSKEGIKYNIIPFEHPESSQGVGTDKTSLVSMLKNELKQRGVPMKKIERNADGTPRLGKLHTFNIASPKPTQAASHPVFHGLSVYQKETSKGKVQKQIMTFRVISEKHKGSKWRHPGTEPKHFMDKAFQWVSDEWEKTILPSILKQFK